MKAKKLILDRAAGTFVVENVEYNPETGILEYKVITCPNGWDKEEDYEFDEDIVLALQQ